MKFKKIMLITFLLLAVLAIGTVSATEDIAVDDNMTVSDAVDDIDVVADSGENIIAEDSGSDELGDLQDANFDYNVPESVRAGDEYEEDWYDDYSITYSCWDWDITGNFSIYIDNENVFNESISGCWGYLDLRNLNLTYGTHTVNITYPGDENYASFNYDGEFEYYYMDVDVPEEVVLGHDCIKFTFAMDATGYVDLYINNTKVETYDVYNIRYYDEEDELSPYFRVYFDDLDLTFGEYTYMVNYYGGNYDNKSVNGTFTINDYYFYVDVWDEVINYGYSASFDIWLPSDADGNVTVTVNGETYTIQKDDEGEFYYKFSDLVYGENNFTFTYSDDIYPEKSVNYTVTVKSSISYPWYEDIPYGSEDYNITLTLPDDAEGNLTVYEAVLNEESWEYEAGDVIKTVELEDGEATISISDLDLNLGESTVIVKYTGEDYDVEDVQSTFTVIPNVVYPTGIYTESGDTYTVTVTTPEDATGNLTISVYNRTLKYDSEDDEYYYTKGDLIQVLYNATANGTVTAELPELETGSYYLCVIYSEDDEEITDEDYVITVSDEDPEWDIEVEIPDEVTYDDDYEISYYPKNIPDNADGTFTFYVDGEKVSSESYDEYDDGWDDCEFLAYVGNLKAGKHNWTLTYTDDSYYNDASVNGTFNLIMGVSPDLTISVANITEGDNAVVLITTNTTFSGNVLVQIGTANYTVNVTNGYGNISISGLSAATYTATAYFDATGVFSDDSASTTFTVTAKTVLVDPALTISVASITQGANAVVKITTNTSYTGNVLVQIANKNYTVSVKNGAGSISIANLAVGTYTAKAIFTQTDVFSASTKSTTFKVTKKANKIKLKLKKVKVKKSAKKLKLKATLKINGKAVKGKKIKFKFNKKTYKAKTNKKGVAKVTIKKKVLKKLKVGKKIKYTAKYSTKTVKRTVKVKK